MGHKILYLACHGIHDNSDEDSISFAMEQLGHEVIRVHEKARHRKGTPPPEVIHADLCLFHKCEDVEFISRLRMRKVFWYFDLLSSDCPSLATRMAQRQDWLARVLPHCVAGFCTDGTFVAQDHTGKLVHLTQGCDERVAGFGTPLPGSRYPPVLFTGMVLHGLKRAEHIAQLQARYRGRFGVLGDGGPRFRKHGRELADVFASVKVVVAPDGPCTDLYWSNRLYLSLSLGAFLIHPHCAGLAGHYAPEELVTYRDRQECFDLIDHYLEHPQERRVIATAGYNRTLRDHTYKRRVRELIRLVEARR